jgi:hypothetical protein
LEASFTDISAYLVSKTKNSFILVDEWYFNMRFVDQEVISVLSAIPSVDSMLRWNSSCSGNEVVCKMMAEKKSQIVAWVFKCTNGGRGFAYTDGHYLSHWYEVCARQLVISAIMLAVAPPTKQQK